MSKKIVFAAIIASTVMSGCASIISKSQTPVTITSMPTGATVKITNKKGAEVHTAITPTTVTLKNGAGYFQGETYSLNFEKDGFQKSTQLLDTGLNPWYAGNVIFGGLLGILIVDPLTGAMWRMDDEIGTSMKEDNTKTSTLTSNARQN